MKNGGIFVVVLMASCVWNVGFAGGNLYHVKRAENSSQISLPEGISGDGATVVGRSREGSTWEAFRWNPSNSLNPFRILVPKEGVISTGGKAYDASWDGRIIVGEGSWNGAEYFYPKIWINDIVVEFDASFGGPAYAISDEGQIIATTHDLQSPYAYWIMPFAHRWDISSTTLSTSSQNAIPAASDFVALPIYEVLPSGTLPGSEYTGARPRGISGDGSVIVGISEIHTADVAVRWYQGPGPEFNWVVEPFEDWDQNVGSTVVAASYDGNIIVGGKSFNLGTEADPDWQPRGFVWRSSTGSMEMLPTLSAKDTQYLHNYTEVFDISGDGKLIVGRSGNSSAGESIAVYWDQTGEANKFEGLVDLNMRTGWEFEGVSAVNNDGSSMAGFGTHNGNPAQTWHLHKAYDDGYGNSEDIGDDWYDHPVIGVFWRAGNSHVWHNQHGWQTMAKGKHDILLFDFGSDSWIWSSEADYPFMFRYGTNPGWVFYQEGGSPGERVFYHFGQEKWMTEIELSGGN